MNPNTSIVVAAHRRLRLNHATSRTITHTTSIAVVHRPLKNPIMDTIAIGANISIVAVVTAAHLRLLSMIAIIIEGMNQSIISPTMITTVADMSMRTTIVIITSATTIAITITITIMISVATIISVTIVISTIGTNVVAIATVITIATAITVAIAVAAVGGFLTPAFGANT